MIRAVLLDAYGTLVRLAPPGDALRTALAERTAITVTPERAEEAMAAEIVHYRARMHRAGTPEAVAALRRQCAGVLRDALAEPRLDALSADAMTEILLAALRFEAFPEVPAALARLRTLGLRCVVVSNWDAALPEVLARAGLLDRLDGVVTSAGVGAAKPDPAVFAAALELAGVPAGEAVHVGDSPREDLQGAARAGLRALLVVRAGSPGSAPAGAETISTLAELPDRLGVRAPYPRRR